MAEHTPGPWAVDTTMALGAYGVWTDYPTHPGHDGAGYCSQICSVFPDVKQPEITREQRDANARLIASAPELLSCLRDLWEWQRGVQDLVPDGLAERVLSALSKAKETQRHPGPGIS